MAYVAHDECCWRSEKIRAGVVLRMTLGDRMIRVARIPADFTWPVAPHISKPWSISPQTLKFAKNFFPLLPGVSVV
jgi:hypothetical protein